VPLVADDPHDLGRYDRAQTLFLGWRERRPVAARWQIDMQARRSAGAEATEEAGEAHAASTDGGGRGAAPPELAYEVPIAQSLVAEARRRHLRMLREEYLNVVE
jgi:hypothetical protein